MRLHLGPGREAAAGDGVLLHIADAALVLACPPWSSDRWRPMANSAPDTARRPEPGSPSAGRRHADADVAPPPGSPHHDAGSVPGRCRAGLPGARRRRQGRRSPSPRTNSPASRARRRGHAGGGSSRGSPQRRTPWSRRRRSPPAARRSRSAFARPGASRSEPSHAPRPPVPAATAPPRARRCAD